MMTGSGTCSNGEVISITTSVCATEHGDQVIKQFGADDLSLYQYELILLLFLIAIRFALLFALYKPPKRV